MPSYAVGFQKTGSNSVQQLVEVLSSATVRRTRWFEISWSNTATPVDLRYSYIVHRVTGSATGSAVIPAPYDVADGASLCTAEHLITADAASFSAGAELLRFPLHANASFRWVANPGRELVGPATSANGLSFGVSAASTSTFAGTVGFEE